MADILNVSRQGYYHYINRSKSQTALRHEYLNKEIKRVFKQHKGRYGSPRIALQLYNEGIETNKRVIATLMRLLGLYAVGYHPKRYKYPSKGRLEQYVKENLVKRQFDRDIVDEIWVTDITYISCSNGRLYLCLYLDLTTRIPRCYNIATNMKQALVLDPLKSYSQILPTVIHSDRGSQYTSHAYRNFLEANEIIHSMSEKGSPVDNAVVESMNRSVKRELVNPNKDKSKAEMKVLIEQYLTDYFVYQRIHTRFGTTPHVYEEHLKNLDKTVT